MKVTGLVHLDPQGLYGHTFCLFTTKILALYLLFQDTLEGSRHVESEHLTTNKTASTAGSSHMIGGTWRFFQGGAS